MVSRVPNYCPECGTELRTREIEGRERRVCDRCEGVVWRNAVPSVAVVVRDGEEILLIERAAPPVGVWAIPGGHPKVDEPPATAAARELREETGVQVAPVDLDILDVEYSPFRNLHYMLVTYAVDRSRTSGDLRAGTDASDARFWSLSDLDDSGERTREIDRRRIEQAINEQ